ncbi:hypothetical protein A4X13_0g5022 [Tilletia indica]|uniref:DUF6604 domain-containing protein n=1 Tax=Tilletia indica TaxID=43049 RepID=A0A177TQD9_9BASI|nr:hypothetical protein A4X13_0g5022 [Tilletia indica]
MFRRGFLNNPARPTSQKAAPAPSGPTPTPTPAPAAPSTSRSAPASDKPKVNSNHTQNRSTFIRSKYQQSKLDTEQISTWLARAAIENGYDFENEFESSPTDDQSPSFVPEDTGAGVIGRTRQQEKNSKKNAKKKAKRKQAAAATTDNQDESSQHQATVADEEDEGANDDAKDAVDESESTTDTKAPESSKPTSQRTLPGGRYRITANQYIKLARFLVDRKVEIPLELLQLLRRCCSLRLATLRRFLPNPDLSTKTHAYFVNVLREVGSLLHEAREEALLERLKNATGAKGKNKNKSDNVRSANRFDSLADLVDELNDDLSDELPDIRLPEPPRPKNAPVIASNAHFSPVDTADECVESILAFFSDLHDVRDYIRELWLDYNEGRTDLLTASVTTNTALELLRRPHEDVMARVMPFFDNSLMTMFQLVVNYVRMRATGDPQIRLVVSFTDVSDDSPDLPFYDFFFVPCWQMVDALTRVITDNHVPLYKANYHGVYDPTLDHEQLPFTQRWQQGQVVVLESLSDYFLLLTQSPPDSTGEAKHSFWGDEMARIMNDIVLTKQCSLLSAFAAQVFVDLNFLLRKNTSKGWTELSQGARRMKASMEQRKSGEPARPKNWVPTNELHAQAFIQELDSYCKPEDPMTSVRRHIAGLLPDSTETEKKAPSYLMQRNPILCGILLFRLQLKHQEFGLKLANTWGTILYTAHLRHACAKFGITDQGPLQAWPDMDLILSIHGAEEMFGGKLPESIDDAQISLLRMYGYSTDVLRAMRVVGTGAEKSPFRPGHKPEMMSAAGAKHMVDRTQVLPIFKAKYMANFGEGTQTDIHTIEKLISDMAEREEDKSRKRQGLRRERRHKAQKFSILQLLSVLETALRSETDSIRLDYVSLHLRCIRVLQRVRASADEYLRGKLGPNYIEDESQLPFVVGWIFHVATLSARAFELMGGPRELRQELGSRAMREIQYKSKLLLGATSTLNHFLRSTGEGDAEVKKMKLVTGGGVAASPGSRSSRSTS